MTVLKTQTSKQQTTQNSSSNQSEFLTTMKFQWDIEDAFNVDPYGPGNKDNLEGHKRRIFVQKVYAILGVAVTITLANALLTMIFMGRFISYSWQ